MSDNVLCSNVSAGLNKPYKKKLRFYGPWILKNEISNTVICTGEKEPEHYIMGPNGKNLEKELEYTRWGFGFHAPIDKSSNSWRYLWIKIFGKIHCYRFTLPSIKYN